MHIVVLWVMKTTTTLISNSTSPPPPFFLLRTTDIISSPPFLLLSEHARHLLPFLSQHPTWVQAKNIEKYNRATSTFFKRNKLSSSTEKMLRAKSQRASKSRSPYATQPASRVSSKSVLARGRTSHEVGQASTAGQSTRVTQPPYTASSSSVRTTQIDGESLQQSLGINIPSVPVNASPVANIVPVAEMASSSGASINQDYPFKHIASTLSNGFKNGFSLQYSGLRKKVEVKNMISAQEHAFELQQKISKEVDLG
ncbi:uncharacterized protein LOC125680185 [Ostrea edulis]|uniref:uncharacterized protein LOC125680185 n=1 Tax=Ostrea edulis TaxID=37623 RepID=UPI0024AFBA50|nr:uncharacterized protein LOC125680185 [Ostrea edulis]